MPKRASKSSRSSAKAQSTSKASKSNASNNSVIICNCVDSQPSSAKRHCCLKQRFGTMFNDKDSSDISFIVGQGKHQETIPAHKLVLMSGSDVFKTMFSAAWSSGSASIEAPDVEPAGFWALLRFLYLDEVQLTSDGVYAVLFTARKYAVEPLENKCIDFLIKNLRPDNVIAVLNLARLLDIQRLTKSCLEAVDENTVEAIAADAFCDTDIDTLCLILSRSTLVITEIKLFEALLRWSKAECLRKNLLVNKQNQRLSLRKALPYLRFPLMSAKEFSSKVAPSGLLSKDELLSMLLYFNEKPRPPISFNDTPRLANRELIVNRFKKSWRGGGTYTGYTGKSSSNIDFTCDRDLELLGYGLYGSTKGTAKYTMTLKLLDASTGAVLRNESADFISDDASMTYKALFQESIKLTAHKKYTARVFTKGPRCFLGRGGMKEVAVDVLHGQKVTITFSNIDKTFFKLAKKEDQFLYEDYGEGEKDEENGKEDDKKKAKTEGEEEEEEEDEVRKQMETTVNKGMIPQLIFKV